LGLALRAAGYKKKVFIIQFGKFWYTGEMDGIKKLKPYVKLVQGGKGFVKLLNDKLPFEEHVSVAQQSFDILYNEACSGKWDVVIADELVGAVAGKVVKLEQVLKLIKDKPVHVDLVLTGHHAHPKIIAKADTVTEMMPIKHPYEKGFLAKPSIDY
jgi:cob(I)alamin adenosyltransferase